MRKPPKSSSAAGRTSAAMSKTIYFCIGVLSIAASLSLLRTEILAQDAANDWPAAEARLRTLLAGNTEEKRTALYEIRNFKNEQASRLAIPALSDVDEIVRATAASSVIFLPEAEARNVLLPLLDDKKPFVRREAAFALGEVGNWGATNRLRRSLNKDRDPEVRTAAAIAIGKIGDHSAIGDLLNILNKRPKEEDELLRRSAARSIGQIFELWLSGSTKTLTPQNFLPSEDKDFGTSKRKDAPVEKEVIDRILAALSKVLRNSNESDDTRREAAFALGAMRRSESAAVLLSHLASPDPYLAEIIKEALLKIQNPN
ncbi:MAG: HEAT repeat domain-containing protein [Chloracidobacterium sp.]|nr:HEAT repeat domain-containing protein [Chloracidobacterium sp.]